MTVEKHRFVNYRVGWVLVGAGLLCGVFAAFMLFNAVGSAFRDTLVRPSCTTPCSEVLDLEAGQYLVFEEIGRSTSVGPFSSTVQGPTTISPTHVTVTSLTGRTLHVTEPGSSQTINRNGAIYGGAVSFDVPEAGRYRVAIDSPPGTRVLVAPGLGQTVLRALPGIGVAAVGFALGLAGSVLLILAWSRRQRSTTPTGGNAWPTPDGPRDAPVP